MTYTFILEFRGGTYIKQLSGRNLNIAIRSWAKELIHDNIKYLGPQGLMSILKRIKTIEPLALDEMVNVWFIYFPIKNGNAFLNIIKTDITSL